MVIVQVSTGIPGESPAAAIAAVETASASTSMLFMGTVAGDPAMVPTVGAVAVAANGQPASMIALAIAVGSTIHGLCDSFAVRVRGYSDAPFFIITADVILTQSG